MRVLVVTGSSGGHIFPALSLLAALKRVRREIEAVLVLPEKNIKYEVIPDSYKLKQISVASLGLRPNFKNLKALLNFFKGSLESMAVFFEFRPDVVAGFGSLNSIPLILFGWLFRAKTIIHEQNLIPGRANMFLSKFCDKIAVSFNETGNYLHVDKNKIIFSGNPLREEMRRLGRHEAAEFFGFDAAKFTILVTGGSQGSHKINTAFVEALPLIPDACRFQIIHISAEEDFDALNKAYDIMGLKIKLFVFLKEMQYAYGAADMAITRAGATTIAELIFFKLPAVIIPYPFAYRHQQANAGILKERGAAEIIMDDELTPQVLAGTINRISANSEKIKAMQAGFGSISMPDAGSILTEAVLSLGLN